MNRRRKRLEDARIMINKGHPCQGMTNTIRIKAIVPETVADDIGAGGPCRRVQGRARGPEDRRFRHGRPRGARREDQEAAAGDRLRDEHVRVHRPHEEGERGRRLRGRRDGEDRTRVRKRFLRGSLGTLFRILHSRYLAIRAPMITTVRTAAMTIVHGTPSPESSPGTSIRNSMVSLPWLL